MVDFLDKLATGAKRRVSGDYYKTQNKTVFSSLSLKKSILKCPHAPVIAEIKAASPSLGVIRKDLAASKTAKDMEKGGAIGISVLTEPTYFRGSLVTLADAYKAVQLPILMKDIILGPSQLLAASRYGASAVLLIQAIFDRGYGECSIEEIIETAHEENLEVLLETHDKAEFQRAFDSKADLIGINNRNLCTLKVDLDTTREVLRNRNVNGKIIVSESGIKSPIDIRFLKSCGAEAFLVGSEIMMSENVQAKVKELVNAL